MEKEFRIVLKMNACRNSLPWLKILVKFHDQDSNHQSPDPQSTALTPTEASLGSLYLGRNLPP